MRREATKLDQAGLLRVERWRECLEAHAHHVEEPTRVGLALEPDHYIIRIARDDHVAGSFAPSPAPAQMAVAFAPQPERQDDVGTMQPFPPDRVKKALNVG